MNSVDNPPPVRVMIFGEEYQIRTNRPEAHTRACARYVDELIQRAHVRGVAEPHRAAVLAALQITDELLVERREAESLAQAVEARIAELAEQLESLAGAEATPGDAADGTRPDPEAASS
ncbi:cell division protein ZapA [Candidatus Palauibacter sp.]|uniref:cell division protein ZapA n=1 Tax=Candidatus Palauibacter sp. TaxID=3101350 RepID=UPI003B01560E